MVTYIESLKIFGGFLDDQSFSFHKGLNSILGAKGSGKSLAIEFLRFVFNQEPSLLDLKEDHDAKISKCLKTHGNVEATCVDDSDKRYLVKRTYDPSAGSPIELTDLSDMSKKEFSIEQLYPILFLSQNEIIKIAEDKTGDAQREFIDRFFDFYHYQNTIEKYYTELRTVDRRFSDILTANLKHKSNLKLITNYREELEKLGRQINIPIFDKYSTKEKEGRAILNQIEFVDSFINSIVAQGAELEDMAEPKTDDKKTESLPSVKRAADVSKKIIQYATDKYAEMIDHLKTMKMECSKEYDDWRKGFTIIKQEYDTVVKDTGGNKIALDEKRKRIQLQLADLEKEQAKYVSKVSQAKVVYDNRTSIIKNIENAYDKYFQERTRRCEYFTKSSNGKLNVTIRAKEDTSAFKNNLIKLKRGSWLKDEDIEKLSARIKPDLFISNILKYEWMGKVDKKHLVEIATLTDVDAESVEKLVSHLLAENSYVDIMGLLYSSVPKDVPSIKLKVADDYKPLNELSVGQKATALLIIALSDGSFPIVIDQPEDSLDLRSIWEDVCKKIRNVKDERQFIFTTHNSSVAVASDTDKFTILQADASVGKVIHSGSINKGLVRQDAIDYLEGGEKTYKYKKLKYNM